MANIYVPGTRVWLEFKDYSGTGVVINYTGNDGSQWVKDNEADMVWVHVDPNCYSEGGPSPYHKCGVFCTEEAALVWASHLRLQTVLKDVE